MPATSTKQGLPTILLIVVITTMVILACGTSKPIATTILTNPSPADLNLEIAIDDGTAYGSETPPGFSFISVTFHPNANPSADAILPGVSIACDGVALQQQNSKYFGSQYVGHVPTLTPPTAYLLTYRNQKSNASISVASLHAAFNSPIDGSSISTSTPAGPSRVTYRVDGVTPAEEGNNGEFFLTLTTTDDNSHLRTDSGLDYFPGTDNPDVNYQHIATLIDPSFTGSHLTITSQGKYSGSIFNTGFADASVVYNFLGQSLHLTLQ